MSRSVEIIFLFAGLGASAALASALLLAAPSTETPPEPSASVPPAETRFEVHINTPDAQAAVETFMLDERGEPVRVNCGTCHATRPPDGSLRYGDQLTDFHTGLHKNHGDLACVACHNPGAAYMSLRLADGSTVPFDQSMRLCAQCHGPQHRDYQRGSHGGMQGYWDLSRGPRRRNTCTDCHDAHAPQFPQMMPVLPPKDRFLAGKGDNHE